MREKDGIEREIFRRVDGKPVRRGGGKGNKVNGFFNIVQRPSVIGQLKFSSVSRWPNRTDRLKKKINRYFIRK